MTLEWHEGTHPWQAHDGYPVHQHSENGVMTIAPDNPSLPFEPGEAYGYPEDHRYLILTAPREEPTRRSYALRQTRTRETLFHLVETAPDGTQQVILYLLPQGRAADVLEAVRRAYENGGQDALAEQETSP